MHKRWLTLVRVHIQATREKVTAIKRFWIRDSCRAESGPGLVPMNLRIFGFPRIAFPCGQERFERVGRVLDFTSTSSEIDSLKQRDNLHGRTDNGAYDLKGA